MTVPANRLKLLAGINEYIDRCETDRITGELLIRPHFSQGGIGQVMVERREKLSNAKKNLDDLTIMCISTK